MGMKVIGALHSTTDRHVTDYDKSQSFTPFAAAINRWASLNHFIISANHVLFDTNGTDRAYWLLDCSGYLDLSLWGNRADVAV